jgi:hypothetical protein
VQHLPHEQLFRHGSDPNMHALQDGDIDRWKVGRHKVHGLPFGILQRQAGRGLPSLRLRILLCDKAGGWGFGVHHLQGSTRVVLPARGQTRQVPRMSRAHREQWVKRHGCQRMRVHAWLLEARWPQRCPMRVVPGTF